MNKYFSTYSLLIQVCVCVCVMYCTMCNAEQLLQNDLPYFKSDMIDHLAEGGRGQPSLVKPMIKGQDRVAEATYYNKL